MVLTLRGLEPQNRYEVVLYGDRGNRRYTDRLSRTTLRGAEAFVNASTPGSDFNGEEADSTVIVNGFNFENGYVARFVDVASGEDGEIQLIQSDGGSTRPPRYYLSALCIKCTDVEPTMSLEAQVKSSSDDAEEFLHNGKVSW